MSTDLHRARERTDKGPMPITLLCPKLTCRAVLCVPDNVRGKHVKCPECGETLIVPQANASARNRSKTAQNKSPDNDEQS